MATNEHSTATAQEHQTRVAERLMKEAIQSIIAARQLTVTGMQVCERDDHASSALMSMRAMLCNVGYKMEKALRTICPDEPGILGDADAWLLDDHTQKAIDAMKSAA